MSSGRGGNPVVLVAGRRVRTNVDIDGAVCVPLHLLIVGIESRRRHVSNEAGGIEIVQRHGPVLFRRDVRRDVETVVLLTVQQLTARVVPTDHVERGRAKFFEAANAKKKIMQRLSINSASSV